MTVADRILAGCIPEPNTGCWLWLNYTNANGYGVVGVNGSSALAHRVSYETFVGPIPDGLQLDHLCRVRCCVNPSHLEPVTNVENSARGLRARGRLQVTHCCNGHEYTTENTRWTNSHRSQRICRTCEKVRDGGSHPWALKLATDINNEFELGLSDQAFSRLARKITKRASQFLNGDGGREWRDSQESA